MPANAPTRSTVKLSLLIGMLPINLDVFAAVEDSNVGRSMYVKDGDTYHKAGNAPYDTVTGKNIERSDIIKCVEAADGTLVEVSDSELQALLTSENGSCTFIGFLSQDKFDYSTEKPYQVRPQKSKTKANPNEKPFALIMESMRESNTVALISFVNRGKTRYAAIDANGHMATIYFDEEVRAELPLPEVTLSDQEKAMGLMFIDTFKLADAPVFSDEDSAKLMQFVEDKAKAQADGTEIVIPVAAAPAAPADDLMALLAASVKK